MSPARTRLLLGVCGMAFVIQCALFACLKLYMIPTGSMEPSYYPGDRVIVLRRWASGEPKTGDIVAMESPVDRKTIFLKRVVAANGDRLHLTDKMLIRNGKPVDEPYVRHLSASMDEYRDQFPTNPANFPMGANGQRMLTENVRNGELVVPPGSYFLMGDNRDYSLDSRYLGLVPADHIVGRAIIRVPIGETSRKSN